MTVSAPSAHDLTLDIRKDIHIAAPLETAFDALLEEMRSLPGAEGQSLSLKLEAWPGGRWYRDLGDGNGHFWGHVQAIKRPTLLEITGPLMMSFAVASNLQYRLTPDGEGTLLTLKHSVLGLIPDDYRDGMDSGWQASLDRVRATAERRRPR